jgi:hypothetical protein
MPQKVGYQMQACFFGADVVSQRIVIRQRLSADVRRDPPAPIVASSQ